MKFSIAFLRLVSLLAALSSFAWTGRGEEKPTNAPEQAETATAQPPDDKPEVAPAAEKESPAPAPAEKPSKKKKSGRQHSRTTQSAPFGNLTVGENERTAEAVTVFGNLVVKGVVEDGAVTVFGNNWINETAKVDDDAVAVFGNLNIDGQVHGDAVAVFGNVYLGPNAKIDGDTQAVFGRVVHTDGRSGPNSSSYTFSHSISDDNPLGAYIRECLMKGRLLWFGPHLGWAWIVALVHLFVYALLALVLRRPTERCVRTFEERPAMSIFSTFLCILLFPIVFILLLITGIGVVVVPILAFAVIALSIFGHTVINAWLGSSVTRFFGDGPLSHVAISTIFGGIILLVLYCIPVVALIVHTIIGSLGFGIVVYTIALSMQKEKKTPQPPAGPAPSAPAPSSAPIIPPPVAPTPTTPVAPLSETATAAPVAPLSVEAAPTVSAPPPLGAAGFAVPQPPAEQPPVVEAPRQQPAEPPTVPPAPPPIPSEGSGLGAKPPCSSLPRASFWTRMKALAIDAVVGSLVIGGWNSVAPKFASISFMPGIIFLMALYGALIWKYRSTSIGGIIFKLQIVRTDDRPLDWSTCVVRALGCILSVFAAGLGFIWIAIDPNREAWHDKIAGTAVVHTPENQRLT